jgi:hypothetical protein
VHGIAVPGRGTPEREVDADMDQAWALEQDFWQESSAGQAGAFYRRTMLTDGYVVLPSGVVSRDELIATWDTHQPIRTYQLSEPRLTLVDGGNVLISYKVEMDADWLPNYAAWMTALYSWEGSGWALAVRTHTPVGSFPF